MADKKIRTIAFQVDDQDFVAQYEARVKESGLSVKNYFVSLIKVDIAQNQAQKESYAEDEIKENTAQTEQVHDTPTLQAEETPVPVAEPESEPEQEQSGEHQPQESDIQSEDTENIDVADAEIPEQEQAEYHEEQQSAADMTEQEEMMNLFVKIPNNQREALEYHKNETGETVGSVLNRLIKDFLTEVRNGNQPENFDEIYNNYDIELRGQNMAQNQSMSM